MIILERKESNHLNTAHDLSYRGLVRQIQDAPRTRQSPRALAAFLPWGIPKDDATWGVASILAEE